MLYKKNVFEFSVLIIVHYWGNPRQERTQAGQEPGVKNGNWYHGAMMTPDRLTLLVHTQPSFLYLPGPLIQGVWPTVDWEFSHQWLIKKMLPHLTTDPSDRGIFLNWASFSRWPSLYQADKRKYPGQRCYRTHTTPYRSFLILGENIWLFFSELHHHLVMSVSRRKNH